MGTFKIVARGILFVVFILSCVGLTTSIFGFIWNVPADNIPAPLCIEFFVRLFVSSMISGWLSGMLAFCPDWKKH